MPRFEASTMLQRGVTREGTTLEWLLIGVVCSLFLMQASLLYLVCSSRKQSDLRVSSELGSLQQSMANGQKIMIESMQKLVVLKSSQPEDTPCPPLGSGSKQSVATVVNEVKVFPNEIYLTKSKTCFHSSLDCCYTKDMMPKPKPLSICHDCYR